MAAASNGNAVTSATVESKDRIADGQAQLLAVAPDGVRWASAWMGGVRVYRDATQIASHTLRHVAAGSMGFTADGQALQLGLGLLDLATGGWRQQAPLGDLAAWARSAGHAAPPSLQVEAARYSPDGGLLISYASGRTRDRRRGAQRPAAGDEDWLIAHEGASRAPEAVLWSGRGRYSHMAMGGDLVAAGGAGLRVFRRGANATVAPVADLSAQLGGIIDLAWSPDGSVLAALGRQDHVAVWRAGQWDAPAALWRSGSDYGSALAFHPTRPLLITGNRDGHIRLWSLAPDALAPAPVPLVEHALGGIVNAIAVPPGGDLIIVAVGAPAGHPAGHIERLRVTLVP